MTTEFSECENQLTQSQYGQSGSVASTTKPSDSLIEWFVGNPPQHTNHEEYPSHNIAQCSRLEPIPFSPMSPPLAEQGPSDGGYYGEYPEDQGQESEWIRNSHITGLAISASGVCGSPNYIQYGGCTVCAVAQCGTVLYNYSGGNYLGIFRKNPQPRGKLQSRNESR